VGFLLVLVARPGSMLHEGDVFLVCVGSLPLRSATGGRGARHLVGADRVPVRHFDFITGNGERSRLDAAVSRNQRLDLNFAIGWLEMSCNFRAEGATDCDSLF